MGTTVHGGQETFSITKNLGGLQFYTSVGQLLAVLRGELFCFLYNYKNYIILVGPIYSTGSYCINLQISVFFKETYFYE